ncbi:MAG: dynamin family protein [Dolichospermum sp. OL03]|nr:dynamin family protein [Dolichospermum sp. OL01]MCO5795962.1 dynamin family protein [Dolichospermum sp. OL03]
MVSPEFQTTYQNLCQLSSSLLQICDEKKKIDLKNGYGIQRLQDIILLNLKKIKEDLQSRQYRVSAISVQRVGKSTFLNAIIGADILARDTQSCTFCKTEIRCTEQENLLLEYRENQSEAITICVGNAEDIKQKFLARTREIRRNNNLDKVTNFELRYSIESMKRISSFINIVFMDTPGSNEWQSNNFDINVSRRAISQAMKDSDIIFVILDYHNYATDDVDSLIAQLVKNRPDVVRRNHDNIYFILNKIDLMEIDSQGIDFCLEDVKKHLTSKFGFLDPRIYPISSKQGLLSKLIKERTATLNQEKEFENFFGAKYAVKNASGKLEIPLSSEIASVALEDSGIPKIEHLIESIIYDSHWKLLDKNLELLVQNTAIIYDIFLKMDDAKSPAIPLKLNHLDNLLSKQNFLRIKHESITNFLAIKQEEWINLLVDFFDEIEANTFARINDYITKEISGKVYPVRYEASSGYASDVIEIYEGCSREVHEIKSFCNILFVTCSNVKNEIYRQEGILIEDIKSQVQSNLFEIAEKFPEKLYLDLSPTQFLGIQSNHKLVVKKIFSEQNDYGATSWGDYLSCESISECIDKSETINAIKRAFTLGKPQAINEVEEKILDFRQVIEKYMNDIENQLIWEHLQYHRRELESFRTSLDCWKPSINYKR